MGTDRFQHSKDKLVELIRDLLSKDNPHQLWWWYCLKFREILKELDEEMTVTVRDSIPTYYFAVREDLQKPRPDYTDADADFIPTPQDFIPSKPDNDPLATGWDVRCADPNGVLLYPFQPALISLGFRAFCPSGWWMELKPRSSTFIKKNLHCLYGTIDESWAGEWKFACQYIPPKREWSQLTSRTELKINFGDRIAQILPVKRQEMKAASISNEELDKLFKERSAKRGTGGFGSTGDK